MPVPNQRDTTPLFHTMRDNVQVGKDTRVGRTDLMKHMPLSTECGGVTVDEKLPLSPLLSSTW